MKKLIFLSALAFTLCFSVLSFSCASKPEIQYEFTDTEIPQEESVEEKNTDLDSQTDDVSLEEQAFVEEETGTENIEVIEEPEIITIEPEEEIQQKIETDSENENEQKQQEEIVTESDLIPPEYDEYEGKDDEVQFVEDISDDSVAVNVDTDEEISAGEYSGSEESENSNTSSEDSAFTQTANNKNESDTFDSEQTENNNINSENSDFIGTKYAETGSDTDFGTPDFDSTDYTESDSGIADLENSESGEEAFEETKAEEEIIPSRKVTLKRGETLVVVYPGSGWIYLGSTSEYSNLTSKGRKLGSTDTSYTLLAKESGTQLHHFYKTDNLTGNYIDDYLEVTVLDSKGKSSTRITAPDYAEIVPKRPEKKVTPQAFVEAASQENSESTESLPIDAAQSKTEKAGSDEEALNYFNSDSDDEIEQLDTPDVDIKELLNQARALFNEKKYAEAEKCLSVYFEYASENRDEALYLLGQIYETESSVKDIKKAVETYQNLIQNYPSSAYWDRANKRIIYLNRFYFEAR